MKLLLASNQPALVQKIGDVLDDLGCVNRVTVDELLRQFESERYDAVIIDTDAVTGIDKVVQGVRAIASRRWIPIVIYTKTIVEAQLIPLFKAGADDLLLEHYPHWLLKAKLGALGRVEHIQNALQQALDKIETLSLMDPHTKLPNYRAVLNEAVRLYGQANREEKPFTIVMIQIDHFSRYIQEHGQTQSQELFHTLAMLVEGSSNRPLDFVGRFDQSTLVLLLPETDDKGARIIANEVLRHVREAQLPFKSAPQENIVTVTAVTCGYVPDKTTLSVEQMFGKLRQGLHEAQTSGYDQAVAI